MRRALGAVVVGLGLVVAGCGGTGTPTVESVGKVARTDYYVAVVTNGKTLRAFVTNGTIAESYTGDENGATFNFESDVNSDSQLGGTLLDGGAVGRFTDRNGQSHAFTTKKVKNGGGFFTGTRGKTSIGWVILNDGMQHGTVTVLPKTSADLPTQAAAPKLDVAAPTVRGIKAARVTSDSL